MKLLLACCSLLALVGCARYNTSTFEVSVTNNTSGPICAGLVKTGLPQEQEWAAPHEIAIAAPLLSDRHWGVLITPGKTATIGPQNGKFASGSVAVLRIYAGNPTVEELIAYDKNDPLRLDLYPWPGTSHYSVRMIRGRLFGERTENAGIDSKVTSGVKP